MPGPRFCRTAELVGLRAQYSTALESSRRRHRGHDPGQVLADLAVALSDGGEANGDIATLTDQPVLYRPLASSVTAWPALAGIHEDRLAELRRALESGQRSVVSA